MDQELLFVENLLSDELTTFGFPLMFKGELTHEVKKIFISMAENKIAKSDKPDAIRRRVFHLLVESLENITKHSDDYECAEDKSIGSGLLFIGEKKDHYYIITGNRIRNDKADILRSYIDELNTMEKPQLDLLHKKQMIEGKLSSKGGAGLGLIEIARKSHEKIKYHFKHLDDNYKFFLMKIIIHLPRN